MKEQRIVFIDYIHIIACFMVMLVHASGRFYSISEPGFSMLANEANRFWVAFYGGFVARSCVPLFIIVSAFLLVPLKPGQTMTGFYKRRFLRILPPLLVFMLIYTLLPFVLGRMTWEQLLSNLIRLPLNFPSNAGHLWFMYPLIGLYLFIPIVSPWLKEASAKEELCFLRLFILSTFIPWIHRFVSSSLWGECRWNEFSVLWYFSGYLGYLVLAHYIHYHLNWTRKRKLTVGLIAFLIGAAFTGWTFWMKGIPGQLVETGTLEWGWGYCGPNILLATFGLFIVFSCVRRETTPWLIANLSKCSFGMYLMHKLFLNPIASWIIGGDPASPRIPVWLAIPAIAFLTFVCCAVTTRLFSRIPGSKWVLG